MGIEVAAYLCLARGGAKEYGASSLVDCHYIWGVIDNFSVAVVKTGGRAGGVGGGFGYGEREVR